jgi:glycosyltransferase involved in cell wall biosynthesis
MPLDVSVIIPTFRRPDQLREAIASALGQDGASVELIVIDDCPDGSAADSVASIGDPRVRYLRNPEPTGGRPAIVRNLGWRRATGDIVHFLDDDDIVPSGHYAAVKAAFAQAPGVGVVFGHVAPFGTDAAKLAHEHAFFARASQRALASRRFGSKWGYAARMLFGETLLVCSSAAIRRACLPTLGGFDPELALMEDVDFYARAIRRFGVRFMDRVAIRYRIWASLMHGADQPDVVRRCYWRMHDKYRAEWGNLDFYALKIFARTVLRVA